MAVFPINESWQNRSGQDVRDTIIAALTSDHTHLTADITDLQAKLDALAKKSDAVKRITLDTDMETNGTDDYSLQLHIVWASGAEDWLDLPDATQDTAGMLSAADKRKLDGLTSGGGQGGLVYKGTLSDPSQLPADPANGWMYIIATAGEYAGLTCQAGDKIVWNGTEWEKVSTQQAGDARYLRKDISDESRGTLTAQVLAVHGRTDAGSTGDKSVIYLDPHTGALKHDTITQTAEGQRHANCELLDESSFMTDEEWDAELRSIGI